MGAYLVVYIEILCLTFIYTGILFFSIRKDMGSDWEILIFRCVLLTLMVALVIDGFTHAQYRGFLHMPPLLVAFLYATYMFLMSAMLSFLWLAFAELRLGVSIFSKKVLIFAIIPLAVIGIMCFASIKTGWFFSVDDQGIYTRGPLWALQSVVVYIYFLAITIHALILAKREPSPRRRSQFMSLSLFIVSPILGALLQLLIGNHPFVAPATSIAFLFIFISLQGNMINYDYLTGISNRKSIEQYIDDLKIHTDSHNAFYVYMMDIDRFKSINDSMGHIEGDQALRLFARILQNVCDKFHGACGRIGGDEFVAVIRQKHMNDPEDFIREMGRSIQKEEKEQQIPYRLQSSIGYARCDSAFARTPDLIAIADKEMYAQKKARAEIG